MTVMLGLNLQTKFDFQSPCIHEQMISRHGAATKATSNLATKDVINFLHEYM